MWVLLAIASFVALVVVIGLLMPVRYEGRTTASFPHGAQVVWDALQDVEAHPMTGRMMKSVERLPDVDGRPAWNEDMGRGEIISVTTPVCEPPRRLVRAMASACVNMTSRWEYALDDAGDGCRVTLSGVTDIERGTWHTPLFRVMMVLGGGVKKGLDLQLAAVAATLNA